MNRTRIEWSDYTWNPWIGCTKVSPACANCYMFQGMKRTGRNPTKVNQTKGTALNKPIRKSRDGSWKIPDGSKVFTCSWSDFFHEAGDQWREEAWKVIKQRPGLTFQILTKRPERIASCLPSDWGFGYPNVWLGVTVECKEYTKRIDVLRTIPAKVRFISFEPLLEEIREVNLEGYHWAIIGGESGPGARITDLEWIELLQKICTVHAVPIFIKQLGRAWALKSKLLKIDSKGGGMVRHKWPTSLQRFEMPE